MTASAPSRSAVQAGSIVTPSPAQRVPGRRLWGSGEDGDLMAVFVQMAREDGADLSGASGDEDSHGESYCIERESTIG